MIRILHVIDHSEAGGAQKLLRDLLAYQRNDFSLQVAVLGKTGSYSADYRALGLQVFEFGLKQGRWSIVPLFNLIKLIQEQHIDLIHAHLFRSVILSGIATHRVACPLILHDHTSLSPKVLEFFFPNFPIRFAYNAVYRHALARAARVVVLTPNTRTDYLRYYQIAGDKAVVLPNAIPVHSFRAASEVDSPYHALGIPPNRKIILTAARLAAEKGWETWIKVVGRVLQMTQEPLTFVIAGTGTMLGPLQEFAALQPPGTVFLLGQRQDIPALLAHADIFLLTSRFEPFGIVLLEAMAAGCPIISTRADGPQTIITHGVDGLLADVGDAGGLAAMVMQLLREPTLRSGLIQQGFKKVSTQYDMPRLVSSINSLYHQVLSEKS